MFIVVFQPEVSYPELLGYWMHIFASRTVVGRRLDLEDIVKMQLSGFPDGLDMRYERKDVPPKKKFCIEVILGFKTKEKSK